MSDYISRADAIEAVRKKLQDWGSYAFEDYRRGLYEAQDIIEALPSADAVKVAYFCDGRKCNEDCSECCRTFDIEHARDFKRIGGTYYQQESAEAEWILCSERLPKAEDMYQPPEQRYLCQLEKHGVRKFCVLSRLKGAVSPFWDWYGIAVYDSDVTAWMPLPKPYKGGDSE